MGFSQLISPQNGILTIGVSTGRDSHDSILSYKKYIGTSVIYKSYHTGHPESKRVINRGNHDMYELSNHHVPIIPANLFEQVKNERSERSNIELDAEGKPKRKAKKYSAAKVKISMLHQMLSEEGYSH